MTGVKITVTADQIVPALKQASQALADMTPLMDLIGAEIEASIVTRFKRGEGPERKKWKPSQRVLRNGGQTLQDSGRLRDSITRRASAREVEIGTNVIYAAIHQTGGKIKPKKPGGRLVFRGSAGLVFAREVTIPARPFMGIDDDDRAIIAETVESYLRRSVGS